MNLATAIQTVRALQQHYTEAWRAYVEFEATVPRTCGALNCSADCEFDPSPEQVDALAALSFDLEQARAALSEAALTVSRLRQAA